MRITIEIEEPPEGSVTVAKSSTHDQTAETVAPLAPADLLARASAIGAISAGPAPATRGEPGALAFTPDPGTTTTPAAPAGLTQDADDAQSAGAAAIPGE